MGEIKSAAEIAMEKLAAMGDASPEERLKWKYGPQGEKLAALYLKEDVDLTESMSKFDPSGRDAVIGAMMDILQRNIVLPVNETAVRTTKKAMEGIRLLKRDKTAVDSIFERIQHVLNHYVKEGAAQKQQAYEQLKQEFDMKLQQAIRQQTGMNNTGMKVDVEQYPQFQEEWRKLQAQMEAQYQNVLEEYRQELAAIQ